MSYYTENADKIEIGIDGENQIRNLLIAKKCKFMQIDLLFEKNNKYHICEVKKQEKFKAPPFDGHGLPPWQLNRRIEFANKFGMIPLLFVIDIESNIIYYQNMKKLIKGKQYLTKTGNRIIFPIESFEILK